MGPGPDKAERIGSIVCFVIASSHRKHGVASNLLNAACKKFSQKGLEFAEAYPVKKSTSAAYNSPGPLSMYVKNGFKTHRDANWVSCSPKAPRNRMLRQVVHRNIALLNKRRMVNNRPWSRTIATCSPSSSNP